jgi:hypothetical protein
MAACNEMPPTVTNEVTRGMPKASEVRRPAAVVLRRLARASGEAPD